MLKCHPRAFAKCPTRHLCGSLQDADFMEGSDCDKFNQRILSQPTTNADTIRSMSDEELAKLLLDGCRGSKCDDQEQNEFGSVNCFECRLKWLKQSAKEEPHEN